MSAQGTEPPVHYCNPNTLLIKESGIHGAGCYTMAAISEGAYIVEYTGPTLAKDQADELYSERPDTYLFCLGEGEYVIDGDTVAAFVNHCCDPNCETDEVDGRVWVIAIRDIAAGEELTYDYNLYDGDDDDPAICHCGAKSCRGTMYGEEEIERRTKVTAATSRSVVPAAGVSKPLTPATPPACD